MGQIKNIKLHIVTDIKGFILSNNPTKTKQNVWSCSSISHNQGCKVGRSCSCIYHANVKFYEEKAKAAEDVKSMSFHIKDIKRRTAEKKAFEAAQPSILEPPPAAE